MGRRWREAGIMSSNIWHYYAGSMLWNKLISGFNCHILLDTYGKAEKHSGKDWPPVSN